MSSVSKGSKQSKSPIVVEISQTLEAALRAMSEEFCFVERLPGIAVVPTPSDPDIHVYSRAEFIQSVCSDRIIDGKNVASVWMTRRDRRKVKKITYAPGKPQFFDRMLNSWVPSPIQPKKGDCALWLAYLDHIFASDPTHRDWFEAWLAYQFQHPGVKLHSAVVFWSKETSTGKSLFGYTMAKLFGEHNFSEIGEGQLHGNFNHWAARKQFVMGEEIRGGNAQRNADYLKALITRKTVTINTKNTPHYDLPDCINYFFTSNHGEAFYIDETDRRFFVHELASKKLEAHYVNTIFQPWLDSGGYSAILHRFLHEINLSTPLADGKPFNPFAAAPQSNARKNMIDASRDEADMWLDDFKLAPPSGYELSTIEDLYTLFRAAHAYTKIQPKSFANRVKRVLHPVYKGNPIRHGDKRPRLVTCNTTLCAIDSNVSLVTLYDTELAKR